MNNNRVLTIQDISCLGQCSTTVALPIISCLGVEACILPSAILSTHTSGFKDWTLLDMTHEIPKILEHWKSLPYEFDVVYTGYIANVSQLVMIENLFDGMCKKSLKIVDPVMGDKGRLYKGFDFKFVDEMRTMCAKSDILVPNITELCALLKEEFFNGELTPKIAQEYLNKAISLGVKKIVLTGVDFDDNTTGACIFDTTTKESIYCMGKKVQGDYHGTGDMFASTLCGCLAKGYSLEQSTQIAVDFISYAITKSLQSPYHHSYGVSFELALPMLMQYNK